MNGTVRSITAVVMMALLSNAMNARAEGFLDARGHDIVDEKGNKVLLRGVGLGNWMLPEGYMWRFGPNGDRPRRIEKIVSDLIGQEAANRFWPQYRKDYITEADIQRIAELGFNSVRPALNSRLFLTEGDDPKYVDEGFQLLEDLIANCRKHGIYVIIDMHGAPGGQTGQNIDDSANDDPELFSKPKNWERLVDLWLKIVQRYKDEPTVAGYDLLNEPLPKRTGAREKFGDHLEPLYKRLTSEIRKIDKKHMIILEGADWSNDWTVFSEPFDENLVYQFHYYCWDRPVDNLNDISRFLNYREKFNRPVWVGETGEKNNTIYWATTQYFEANNIGWSFWPWKKMEASNGIYSIKAPEGWDQVSAYSRGQGKPSAEISKRALDRLLQSIKLENCVYHGDVTNALFHRIPGKVEAENYGHDGVGKSYAVASTGEKCAYYRKNEPVIVVPVQWPPASQPATFRNGGGGGQARELGTMIKLSAGEWTAYRINSPQAKSYRVTLKAEPELQPAQIQLSFNDQTQEIAVDKAGGAEIPIGDVNLQAGENRLQLSVKSGVVWIDWCSFE